VTETEALRALAATRLELLNVERERDEWKRKHLARKQGFEAAVRRARQADTDADCAWQQVDLLRSRIEDLELELSGVEVAFP
jgi:RecA-family ATPase